MPTCVEILKVIVRDHSSALPAQVVREIAKTIAQHDKKDPWSLFVKLPGACSRSRLGSLAKAHGRQKVDEAVRRVLSRGSSVKSALPCLLYELRLGANLSMDGSGSLIPEDAK